MNVIKDDIDHDRRRFIGRATMAAAATQLGTQLGMSGPAEAQQGTKMPAIKPGTHTSFAPLKQSTSSSGSTVTPKRRFMNDATA